MVSDMDRIMHCYFNIDQISSFNFNTDKVSISISHQAVFKFFLYSDNVNFNHQYSYTGNVFIFHEM